MLKKKDTYRYYYFTPVHQKFFPDILTVTDWNWLLWVTFCLFTPFLKTQKIRTLKTMKTTAGDIIILHMCTKNHNYMRYSSRDTEWVRQKNLSFWVIFCPFTPLTTWKTKILKKMKKVSFYTSVPKIMIICYMLLEIWSATDTIFCCFGSFFALLSHYIDPEKKL